MYYYWHPVHFSDKKSELHRSWWLGGGHTVISGPARILAQGRSRVLRGLLPLSLSSHMYLPYVSWKTCIPFTSNLPKATILSYILPPTPQLHFPFPRAPSWHPPGPLGMVCRLSCACPSSPYTSLPGPHHINLVFQLLVHLSPPRLGRAQAAQALPHPNAWNVAGALSWLWNE